MKTLKRFLFCIFALLFMTISVNAETVSMTAEELLATASDGVITLTEDVELTTSLAISSQNGLKELNLNNHTLTLIASITGQDGKTSTNPIVVFDTTFEIKNGTIKRDKTLTRGGLVLVGDKTKGADAHIILTDVVLDGNNVFTSSYDATKKNGDWIYYKNNYQVRGIGAALYVGYNADVTLTNTIVKNHEGNFAVNIINAGNVEFLNSKVINNNSDAIKASGTKVSFINTEISNNMGNIQIGNDTEFVFDSDSIIKNNVSSSVGALEIQNNQSEYTVRATIAGTIEGNEAVNPSNDVANGGGVYIITTNPNSVVTFTKTAKIINNIAGGAGGGIYVNSYKDKDGVLVTPGKVIIDGSTITGNTAKSIPVETTLKDGGGAGIYVARGNLEIRDAIIKDNISTSNKGSAIIVSHAGGALGAGKLTIQNATINGDILLGQYLDGETKKDAGSIVINSGTYSVDVSNYVTEVGYASKKINDNYVVAKENEVKIETVENGKVEVDKTKAIIGETVTLKVTPNEGYEIESLKVIGTENTEIAVKDNKFTMPNASVNINVKFKKIETTTDFPVFDTIDEIKTVEIGVSDKNETEKVLLESLNSDEKLKDIAKDESVKVAVEIEKIEVIKEVEEKIKETVKAKYENMVITNYFDITVAVKNSANEELGTISKLTNNIKLMVTLPEDLKLNEEGKTRNYYIVRQHGEEIEIIDNVKLSEDGKSLIFETNKFSTYAIAYEDVVVEENISNSPQTGDNILGYVFVSSIAILGIVGTISYIKKKKLFN